MRSKPIYHIIPFIVATFSTILSGCLNISKNSDTQNTTPSFSQEEQTTLKLIGEFFDARIIRQDLVELDLSGNADTILVLKFETSALFEKYPGRTEMNASNAAYRYFVHLKGLILPKYKEIRIIYLKEDPEPATYVYTINELALFESKMKIMKEVYDFILSRNYAGLHEALDSTLLNFSTSYLIRTIAEYEQSQEPVSEFQLLGFERLKSDTKGEVIAISGLMLRQPENNYIRIFVSPKKEDTSVYYLSYVLRDLI